MAIAVLHGLCTVNAPVASPRKNMAIEAPSKGIGVAIHHELTRGIEALNEVG